MNKHKRNLDKLRSYLGRDTHGLKLLKDIARDLTQQRQQIASLKESEATAVTRANHSRQEAADVQKENTILKNCLETEKRRLASRKAQSTAHAARIAQLESDAEVEDEAPVRGVASDIDQTAKIVALFKSVRRRYKRIPASDGPRQVFRLEDLVKNYTGDEFMGLGMLIAALALHGFPAYIQADHTIKEMPGWTEKNSAKFVRWYGRWISVSATEVKVRGHWDGPVTETNPFSSGDNYPPQKSP